MDMENQASPWVLDPPMNDFPSIMHLNFKSSFGCTYVYCMSSIINQNQSSSICLQFNRIWDHAGHNHRAPDQLHACMYI